MGADRQCLNLLGEEKSSKSLLCRWEYKATPAPLSNAWNDLCCPSSPQAQTHAQTPPSVPQTQASSSPTGPPSFVPLSPSPATSTTTTTTTTAALMFVPLLRAESKRQITNYFLTVLLLAEITGPTLTKL